MCIIWKLWAWRRYKLKRSLWSMTSSVQAHSIHTYYRVRNGPKIIRNKNCMFLELVWLIILRFKLHKVFILMTCSNFFMLMYCKIACFQSWVGLGSSQIDLPLFCIQNGLAFFCDFLNNWLRIYRSYSTSFQIIPHGSCEIYVHATGLVTQQNFWWKGVRISQTNGNMWEQIDMWLKKQKLTYKGIIWGRSLRSILMSMVA